MRTKDYKNEKPLIRTASIAALTRSDLISPFRARLLISPALLAPELLQAMMMYDTKSVSIEYGPQRKVSILSSLEGGTLAYK